MPELHNIAVRVHSLTNGDHLVRLAVQVEYVYLEPVEAANLAQQLTTAADEAVHADRAARRG